ncbi:Fungal Zn(2)-Cys(6) binuclear cluster domain-containing protein 3 [Elsinoe fawcettii]|nr:Fungal Zn(2)-Cys(6) binuclear cluster domain-containing protein 3 [Elsinoe fawcettii]
MSNYPPPPQPDQQHYNPIYPPASAPQQQPPVDAAQQEQINFVAQLQQQPLPYPKVEHEGLDPSTSSAIEQRIEQLQHQQQSLQTNHFHQEPQPQQHPHNNQFHEDGSPQQQQHHHAEPTPEGQSGQQTTPGSTSGQHQKLFRLRKACDSCSIRKVKCDESGPPCKACAALELPCTFDRPSRRRGPPNRHAEAIKRRKLEENNGSPTQQMPSSPTHAAQALAALSSHPAAPTQQLSAESILPIETIDLLINDYFTYIHPLCPFPHEPSFREAWRRREDVSNRPFLALLASMVAALVASFPRKPRLHLKAQRRDNLYASHVELVDKCFKVCSAARGPGYLESPHLTVHDAATSYLLGMAGTYTFRWRSGRLYLGECLTIIKALGLHKAKDNAYLDLGGLPTMYGSNGPGHEGSKEEIHDHITLQVSRRVFWTAFVSSRSISQVGASNGEMYIPPSNPTDPYPPLPVEVEDFCIFPTHIEQQPPGLLPTIAGFNANVKIFLSYQPLTVMEMAWGIDSVVDWERQRKIYHDCLLSSKHALKDLPEELKLLPGEADIDQSSRDPLAAFHMKMGLRDPASFGIDGMEQSQEQRRALQREIQKANIYVSGLATRSYIVEKFWSAYEARSHRNNPSAHSHAVVAGQEQALSPSIITGRLDSMLPPTQPPQGPPRSSAPEDIEAEMSRERETIIRSLLIVLSKIDRVNMEPNGDSFAHKIRFIASTLLDVPRERKGEVAQQAEEYLKAFLEILVKLEKAGMDTEAEESQELELRHWADLRDYQAKFAQQGGVFGFA